MKLVLSGCEHGQPAEGVAYAISEVKRCTSSYRESSMDPLLMRSQHCSEDNMKILQSGWEHGSPTDGIDYLLRTSRERESESEDMKIMLSALEQGTRAPVVVPELQKRIQEDPPLLWNLVSYYYMRGNEKWGTLVRDNSKEMMVDSGAFSFMHGQKADFDQYTKDYADFIERWDRPNVVGYFEMDIDKVVGYDKVLQYRRQLERITDKIIPVWHNSRGIKDYIQMCKDYSGGIVAITGAHKEIRDEDFPKFLKTAHDYGCKLHCLGMTRKSILDTVPFDYVDSSSWAIQTVFGKLGSHKRKIDQQFSNENKGEVFGYAYLEGMRMQRYYYEKWRKVCQD